jgi:hypothetical protein
MDRTPGDNTGVVIAEAWRGGSFLPPLVRDLYADTNRDLIDDALAKHVGEALAATEGAGTVDALVMASTSTRGDRVLTGDPGDPHPVCRPLP